MPPLTQGWKTSEFWLTAGHQVISLVVLLGLLTVGDAATLEGALTKAVPAVFLLIGQATTAYKYLNGREVLKKASIVATGETSVAEAKNRTAELQFRTAELRHNTAELQSHVQQMAS